MKEPRTYTHWSVVDYGDHLRIAGNCRGMGLRLSSPVESFHDGERPFVVCVTDRKCYLAGESELRGGVDLLAMCSRVSPNFSVESEEDAAEALRTLQSA